jgi:glutamate synthase domain-containing protein 1
VAKGLQVLDNLVHRGASGSDPETGDGAGILIQVPDRLLRRECDALGIPLPAAGQYGVGMVFLPRDEDARRQCEAIIESVTRREGLRFLGWRTVPTDNSGIGRDARAAEPVVKQFFIGHGLQTPDDASFDRKLYVVRRVIENEIPTRPGFRTLIRSSISRRCRRRRSSIRGYCSRTRCARTTPT